MSKTVKVKIKEGINKNSLSKLKPLQQGKEYESGFSFGSHRIFSDETKYITVSKKQFTKLFEKV